jgi:hypothetical protein
MNRNHHRLRGDKSDRHQIAIEIERQFGLQFRHCYECRSDWHEQGVAVTLRTRHPLRPDHSAATRPVAHDRLLSPHPAQAIRHDARDHIRA